VIRLIKNAKKRALVSKIPGYVIRLDNSADLINNFSFFSLSKSRFSKKRRKGLHQIMQFNCPQGDYLL